jgi:hypothetical protein
MDEHSARLFLRGESLKESDSPPDPDDVVAQAIVEDLETFREF